MELRLTLRRGESVLLTLIIPVGLLLFFTKVNLLPDEKVLGGRPIDFVTPGVLALAVLSTAFTGQAIATGFERSYGVLKRLGASALPRWVLLLGKTLGVLAVEVLQIVVLVAVGYALGWHPHGNPLAVLLLLVVGTAAFSALGLLMAGTLRAEATLAAANGIYLSCCCSAGSSSRSRGCPARCRASPRCCPAPRSPPACAASSKPARPCPGATSACSPSGPPSPACSPPAPSAGSNKINASMILV